MKKDQKNATVGIISVGVPWFDVAVAKKNLDETRLWLENSWTVYGPQEIVLETEQLENA